MPDARSFAQSSADPRGRLYTYEIKAKLFGFPPRNSYADLGPGQPGCAHFSPARVGRARYRSVSVSVGRALSRLERRGLAEVVYGYSRWTAIVLTPAGLDIAKRLAVDTSLNGGRCQPSVVDTRVNGAQCQPAGVPS